MMTASGPERVDLNHALERLRLTAFMTRFKFGDWREKERVHSP